MLYGVSEYGLAGQLGRQRRQRPVIGVVQVGPHQGVLVGEAVGDLLEGEPVRQRAVVPDPPVYVGHLAIMPGGRARGQDVRRSRSRTETASTHSAGMHPRCRPPTMATWTG